MIILYAMAEIPQTSNSINSAHLRFHVTIYLKGDGKLQKLQY